MNRETRIRAAGIVSLAAAVVVIGAIAATSLDTPPVVAEVPTASPAASAPVPPTTSPSTSIEASTDFSVSIAADLEPTVREVEGLDDGDPARPVGRMAEGESATDVVLDELIVSTESVAALQAFLDRWNGELLDSFPPVDGVTDHLVRIDASTADVTNVAANLGSFEGHEDIAVSDEATLRLLAILAAETAGYGTQVALNPIETPAGVPDGTAQESEDHPNPFTWSYLRGGGTQDFAVGPAWQLLEAHGKLERTVRVLINDGGFTSTADFPDDVTLRKADWGQENALKCTGGTPCPYHGTDVTMTLVGQLDNQYGTVGPAGPVVDELILVAVQKDTWKRLRTLEDMVEQYRPDIVNMSYGTPITVGRDAARWAFDRRYKHMHDLGALLVAAAGNDGLDLDQETCRLGHCSEWLELFPCESDYVLCVGGVDRNSTAQSRSGGRCRSSRSTTRTRRTSTSRPAGRAGRASAARSWPESRRWSRPPTRPSARTRSAGSWTTRPTRACRARGSPARSGASTRWPPWPARSTSTWARPRSPSPTRPTLRTTRKATRSS
jgi:hypothetical protein